MTLPLVEPVRSPFGSALAANGIVEAQSENILIGSPLSGIVTGVFVSAGQKVSAHDPLFSLDDRPLRAEEAIREALLSLACEKIKRLKNLPRRDEIPPKRAKVLEAQRRLEAEQDQMARAREVLKRKAITDNEYIQRKQALFIAEAQLDAAQGEYDLLMAGAWESDKALAQADIAIAEAQLDQTRLEIARLVVHSPIDGQVLQINVRLGVYVNAAPLPGLIVLGNVDPLHIRVDIDEHDIPRFHRGSRAEAFVKGHQEHAFPLSFQRTEPFVVPKRSLSGDPNEQEDIRVLQAIYSLPVGTQEVFVGQQMDVFIETH